tara:strand:+ start:36 stop:884 length:849 start_codon:yes stop_codon:yes gene_type:complete
MICFPRLGDYGRLGNAMFQYSALLGIADKHGYTPVYDYNKKGSHTTLHEVFEMSKAEDMEHWKQVHGARRIWKEPTYHFTDHVFDKNVIPAIGSAIKEDTGLNGYFQSEKYFKHIESIIRDEFKFSKEINQECDEKIKQIKEATNDAKLIALHVRLGDYKMLEHVYTPLIKTPYYQEAIVHIENEIDGDAVFIIFSDEIEVCKQLFQGKNCVFAEGGTEAQDMCLMSKCEHNIISNSSFSWWGAWLNTNENKIVMAPNNWFTPNEKDQKNTKDLYCDSWTVI